MKKAISVKQKKRGPGRPKTDHEFLGVRLPKGTTAVIDKLAADNDMSRSETVRAVMAAHAAWEPLIDFLHECGKRGPAKTREERERRNTRALELQQQAIAKTDEIFGRR